MKNRNRVPAILLMIALLLSSSAALAESDVAPGYLQDTSPITLQWYINFNWFGNSWGENLFTQTVTKETGVTIEFIAPAGNEADKLNSLIISDELPDLLTMDWTAPQIDEMINADMLYALDTLADQYDPYFYQVSTPSRLNWYTKADGHVYGYPNASYTPEDYDKYDTLTSNHTFLVRKDMYEAIGSPDMTTPEGFSDAVRKAAELFPEVDGLPLIPIGSHVFSTENGCISFDEMLFSFLAVPYVNADGSAYDRYTDPDYLTWLKAFRQLGEEGYLEDDIFIDQRDQISEKIAQGRYFALMYQNSDLTDQQKVLWDKTPENPGAQAYVAVDGPKNAKGDDYVLPGGTINGWTLTLISKKVKDPARAIRFLSYLMSEHGQQLIWMGGPEGEVWAYNNSGVPQWLPETQALYNDHRSDPGGFDETIGGDANYWMLMDNPMGEQWKGDFVEHIRQLKHWTAPYVTYLGQYSGITFPMDTPESNANVRINAEWSLTLPKLLLAESDAAFDQVLANFVAKRAEYGYDIVMAEKTRQIQENIEKLGVQ
jgi:putative aldouronate transport system substrate-binding protein